MSKAREISNHFGTMFKAKITYKGLDVGEVTYEIQGVGEHFLVTKENTLISIDDISTMRIVE